MRGYIKEDIVKSAIEDLVAGNHRLQLESIEKAVVKSEIEGLITQYKRLQLKAMYEDNRDKVIQFTGSMVSLTVLAKMLNIDIKEDYSVEEEES